MNEERKAKALLLFVVIVWGLNVVMVKFLGGYFSPLLLATIRIGAAALLLTVAMGKMYGFPKMRAGEWGAVIGIAVTGIFLHQVTLAAGTRTTAASTASLILGLNPLVTSVLAYAIFREPLTARKIAGLLLGFSGVLLVVFGDSWQQSSGVHFGQGEMLMIIAMLVYVVSGLFIKKATQTVPVMVVTGYSHIAATVLLLIASAVQGLTSDTHVSITGNWWVWTVLLFSAWVSTALGAIWWNSGIRVIGAGRTAMFLNGMPAMSLVFSMLFLGEKITWMHVIGFAIVFAAVYLGTSQKKRTIVETPPQANGLAQ